MARSCPPYAGQHVRKGLKADDRCAASSARSETILSGAHGPKLLFGTCASFAAAADQIGHSCKAQHFRDKPGSSADNAARFIVTA
jgi:hypothetical protein